MVSEVTDPSFNPQLQVHSSATKSNSLPVCSVESDTSPSYVPSNPSNVNEFYSMKDRQNDKASRFYSFLTTQSCRTIALMGYLPNCIVLIAFSIYIFMSSLQKYLGALHLITILLILLGLRFLTMTLKKYSTKDFYVALVTFSLALLCHISMATVCIFLKVQNVQFHTILYTSYASFFGRAILIICAVFHITAILFQVTFLIYFSKLSREMSSNVTRPANFQIHKDQEYVMFDL